MMSMKKAIAVITALCVFLLVLPAQAVSPSSAELTVNRDGITINGTALPLKPVAAVVTDGDAAPSMAAAELLAKTHAIGEAAADGNGAYSLTLPLPLDLPEGDYLAMVTPYGRETEVIPFTITQYENSLFVDYKNGNDNNSGSISSPFKTITEAQSAARELKKTADGEVTVYLCGGVHYLDAPLTFTEADNGTKYSAFENESPQISGGTVIDNWSVYDEDKNIYTADAKDVDDTRQLYVNGARAQRARSEDDMGILTLGAEGCEGFSGMENWKNQSAVELVYQPLIFTNSRCPVNKIENKNGTVLITMQEPGWTYMNDKGRLWGLENDESADTDDTEKTDETNGKTIKHPWYIENAYELLDEPGEWYLDKAEDKFYYMPLSGEDMDKAYVVAARLEKLLDVCGSDLNNFAENIEFNGITFAESTWLRPNTSVGHVDAQCNFIRKGEEYRDSLAPAAVTVARAKNIAFENCTFTRLGINGINLVDGVQNTIIRGGEFYDISGGAINVGRSNILDTDNACPSDERLYMKNILVNNNRITKIGVEYRSAAAISAGYPIDSEFSHNEISDIPYSGFHIGYDRSGSGKNVMSGVKITNNYIYNILNDYLYDGGAIYTNGRSGASYENPNIISGNYIKDQYADSHALYNDNTSQFWHHENNVVDLRSSEKIKWRGGRIPTWAGCTVNGDYKGITYKNNYTTTAENRLTGRDEAKCSVSDTHLYPSAQWPREALDIISNAGLTAEYDENHTDRINLSDTIADSESWSISGGEVNMKTITLTNGTAAYLHGTDKKTLHFNLKLSENAKAIFDLSDKYSLELNKSSIILKDGAGQDIKTADCEFAENTVHSLELELGNRISLTADGETLIFHRGDGAPVTFTARAQGEISLGKCERAADLENLARNSSFEEYSSFLGGNKTEWWKNTAADITVSADSHSGEKSAEIYSQNGYAGLNQSFTLDADKYYDISVWVKFMGFEDEANNTAENQKAQIVLTRHHADGTEDYSYLATGTPVKLGDWVQLRASYRNTSETILNEEYGTSLKIRIGDGKKANTYLMDDLTVCEIAPELADITANGEFYTGGKISFTHSYNNLFGTSEEDVYYRLYGADNAEFTEGELLAEGFAEAGTIPVPSDFSSTFIRLELTPVDGMGLYGTPAYTDLSTPIAVKITDNGETVTLTAENTSAYTEDGGRIILAVYDGAALKDVKTNGEPFVIGKAELSGCTVKAFYWKGFTNLKSIGESIKIEY